MAVEAAWAAIVDWCRAHAPATSAAIRPAADPAAVRAAEELTGARWPAELHAWYRLADGTERTPAGYVLPGYRPLPVDELARTWRARQEFAVQAAAAAARRPDPIAAALGGEAEDPYDVNLLQRQPAGTPAGLFLPSFLPIAEDQSGSDLFVDTRPGLSSGCITEFVKGDADSWGPRWKSVATMLENVADALHAARSAGPWHPEVDGQRLSWTIPPT
jgi:cell wall assembly regulator SMI1